MLAEERLAEYRRDSQPRSASPRCPRSSDEPGSLTEYRIVAAPRVDLDIAAMHQWYENEQPGVGLVKRYLRG